MVEIFKDPPVLYFIGKKGETLALPLNDPQEIQSILCVVEMQIHVYKETLKQAKSI